MQSSLSTFKAASLTLNLTRNRESGLWVAEHIKDASRRALGPRPLSVSGELLSRSERPRCPQVRKAPHAVSTATGRGAEGGERLPARAAALSCQALTLARTLIPNFPRCSAKPGGGDCNHFRDKTRPRGNYVTRPSGRKLQIVLACFSNHGGRQDNFGIPC